MIQRSICSVSMQGIVITVAGNGLYRPGDFGGDRFDIPGASHTGNSLASNLGRILKLPSR